MNCTFENTFIFYKINKIDYTELFFTRTKFLISVNLVIFIYNRTQKAYVNNTFFFLED